MVDAIASGMFEIWRLADNAYALIEFVDTRYGKTLNVLTVAGGRDAWETGLLALEKIARDEGATCIYSIGHPGWRNLMQAHGYKTMMMMKMMKEV